MPGRSWEPAISAGDGRGAGVRMELQHRSDLPLSGLDQTFKQVAIGGNSMPHRVPTMFRNLTANRVHFALLWQFKGTFRGISVGYEFRIGKAKRRRYLWKRKNCQSSVWKP